MAGGRPPRFSTPDDMQQVVDAYFEDPPPPYPGAEPRITIAGLARALGFAGRQGLQNYAGDPEFMDIVKSARARVEECYEHRLAEPGCTGAIFALKNMGWSDRIEAEHSGELRIVLGGLDAKL